MLLGVAEVIETGFIAERRFKAKKPYLELSKSGWKSSLLTWVVSAWLVEDVFCERRIEALIDELTQKFEDGDRIRECWRNMSQRESFKDSSKLH